MRMPPSGAMGSEPLDCRVADASPGVAPLVLPPQHRRHRAGPRVLLPVDDFVDTTAALIEGLRSAFGQDIGEGRFCTVEAERLPEGASFMVRLADRPQLVEEFTDEGEAALRRIRPALTLFFQYTSSDGAVWLKSPLRAADAVDALFRCFGGAVLRSPVSTGSPIFDLDRLKHPFRPLPDGDDMEMVRVK